MINNVKQALHVKHRTITRRNLVAKMTVYPNRILLCLGIGWNTGSKAIGWVSRIDSKMS